MLINLNYLLTFDINKINIMNEEIVILMKYLGDVSWFANNSTGVMKEIEKKIYLCKEIPMSQAKQEGKHGDLIKLNGLDGIEYSIIFDDGK